ncbi:ATP-grasp domain-containing protein [Streptomyces sp. NPDC097617]|uniref:ATP-grasp domain-containing protein n=1 Tax=Streptomyces sp. NPDC097617 TaxID=3366091 RepID=UPI0038020474
MVPGDPGRGERGGRGALLRPARRGPRAAPALRGPALRPDLVSDIVCFAREYRLFVLDGAVHDGSRYAVGPRLDPAPLDLDPYAADVRAFAAELLAAADGSLPSAAVVDVGLLEEGGWAAIEANPAWASGGYACDPDRVLDVVLRAAGPRNESAPADLPLARTAQR